MRFILLICSLFLSGCSSTGSSSFALSTATITEVMVEEMDDSSRSKYQFSFKYEISNFIETENIYFCSVSFFTLGGKTFISPIHGELTSCEINVSSGMGTFIWVSKNNKTESISSSYFLLDIYQKEDRKVSHSISNAQLVKLSSKI
jgi:hypothetical protein